MQAAVSRLLVLAACGLAASCVAACTADDDSTQLIVTVNSDYEPETELAHVDVSVTGAGRTTSKRWRIVRSASDAEDATALPFSFGIRPPHGDAGAHVEMIATALDPEGQPRVRRRVRVGFVAGERRLLRIDLTHDCEALYRSCEQADSGPARTCIDGECESIDIDVNTLPEVEPKGELAGVERLPPWCDDACMDGGDAEGEDPDAPAAEAGPDTTMPEAGPNAGMDGGDGGGGGGGSDASDVSDAGDGGDAGPSGCGQQDGFFADVERHLTTNAEGVLCPIVAHNTFVDETGTPQDKRASALENIALALEASFDILELNVLQQGATLYATGRTANTTDLPALSTLFTEPVLQDANQPLKLYVSDDLETSSDFASALLESLVSPDGARYASDCRPLYLVSEASAGFDALLATRELLASDDAYAALRGHVHFGAHIADGASIASARNTITQLAGQGFEIVELDMGREGLLVLAAHARASGLQVFVRGAGVPGITAPLCGLVDVLEAGTHATMVPTAYRIWVVASRRLIDLDVTSAADDATQLTYFARPPGGQVVRALDGATPALATGDASAPLVGTYLSFDASSEQSLPLHDAALPVGSLNFAALVLLRLSTTSIAMGERQVIASKWSTMAGWSFELVNASGTTELRLDLWVDDPIDGATSFSTSLPASSLDTSRAHLILFGYNGALEINDGAGSLSSSTFIGLSPFIESAVAVTLGTEPDGATAPFDGDLQLFKLVAY